MMIRRKLIFAFFCAVLTGCSLSDSGTPQEQQAQPTPIPTTAASARPTYTVQRGTVEQVLEFSGRWLPRDQQQLSFEVAGNVRAVNVRAGDTVSAGDVLADYQIEDLEEQLANAELQLETAQLNLAESAEGGGDTVTDAAYNLASANLSLEGAKESLPWTNTASASAGIVTAERNLEDARRAYDEAISRPDSSASAVDNARNAVISAEEALANAWRNYYSASQSYSSAMRSIETAENAQIRAEQDYQDALNGVGVSTDLIQAVRSAQLNVDQIKQDIARSTLLAPSDGVVLEVTIKPGDSVQAYATVITIGRLDPKEVVVNLAYTDASRLNVGMSGACTPINRPDLAVECIVRRLPLSNRDVDQSVRVAATFYEDEAAFGALIDVTMALETREDVLWLPPEAIRTFQNRTFVVVQEADGQRVVDITLGLQTNDRIEIASGLNEGDVVVAP
jgi:multidrug efflux pump subunit AcrA (membrane-fusion protein)